ncbi:calcium-binding protein, partial [Paraburkholderia heleia]|uniref:calcium-binding protein n=1 Tax=Paraburkholderia heleia TaxID=634127 RepID=UPI002AB6C4DB
MLTGQQGVNNIIVGAASDTIMAGNLNDTITAGKGDILFAGAGIDTFIYSAGDGAVTLNEASSKTAGTDQDVVELGAGITATATRATRDASNNLTLTFGSGDQLKIASYFSSALDQPSIVFADGTVWTSATVPLQPSTVTDVDTGAGGNVIVGQQGVNNIIVGVANDVLLAGNLNDTLTAGKGDTLFSGAGVDTFVYNAGDGAVTLYDVTAKTAGANHDVVDLGAGITAASTHGTRDAANDLVLGFGNGDQLTVSGYFSSVLDQPSI